MLLEAANVSVTFGRFGGPRTAALRDVTLQIERPSIVAVVGESGSGKTTLTRLLLGLLQPDTGRVAFRGEDLRETDPKRFRRAVQAIFQDPFASYNPAYRVDRALLLPARRFGLARSDREARILIERALEQVGLRPRETLGRYPHQLSGGQRQRLMVARALMLQPAVLVADEPVSMVDASLRSTILESLYRMHTEHGVSIVYVTHDLTTAYQVADRIVVMRHGEIVEDGDAESVIHCPQHPYTRALIAAVPPPDPTLTGWLEDEAA